MPRNGLLAALADFFVIGAGFASAAPPHLVKDVDDATLGQLDRILLETGGLVYLTANGYVHRSDGTASGTFPIAPSGGFGPSSASALGGALIACGREGLIRSDGSVPGTQLLRRFSFVADDRLARLGTHVYFDGSRYGSTELWRTDGTAAGTLLFKTFAAEPNDKIQGLVATSDRLYFTLGSPRKLFVSDGTPGGTTLLGEYAVDGAVAVGGRLFFLAWQAGGFQKLFVTDGTAAGTVPLFTLAASSVKPGLTALADRVVFRNVVQGVGVAPWVSDGTVAGTGMLRSMDMESFGEEPFEVAGGAAYFLVRGDLWRTDGTTAGTSLVKAGLHFSDVISSGSRLLLDVFHSSLWVSDGTPQGTLPLGSFPAFLRCPDAVELGGRLFFGFDHTRYGTELWATDGTPSGTGIVVDLDRRTLGFGPSLLVAGSTRAYLSYGIFYTTDGTEGGTHPLTQGGVLLRGSNPSFAVQGDTGYLCGDKLWRTDGTDAGTITLSPAGHSCEWVVHIGEQIHFLTRSPMNQSVLLWRSDGSPQGTALVRDLGKSFGAYGPVALDGGIVFVGNRYPEGPELWISDGTSGGTHLVA
ncbi:MAG: hypothetical protein JNK60_15420, partial [Acidobacteria bacterium]|nr:hypothetical protein [Acidobacteriota bacterium]